MKFNVRNSYREYKPPKPVLTPEVFAQALQARQDAMERSVAILAEQQAEANTATLVEQRGMNASAAVQSTVATRLPANGSPEPTGGSLGDQERRHFRLEEKSRQRAERRQQLEEERLHDLEAARARLAEHAEHSSRCQEEALEAEEELGRLKDAKHELVAQLRKARLLIGRRTVLHWALQSSYIGVASRGPGGGRDKIARDTRWAAHRI